MCNFVANQKRWDRGDVTVYECWKYGRELKAYQFCHVGTPCVNATLAMKAAFLAGYNGEDLPEEHHAPVHHNVLGDCGQYVPST